MTNEDAIRVFIVIVFVLLFVLIVSGHEHVLIGVSEKSWHNRRLGKVIPFRRKGDDEQKPEE